MMCGTTGIARAADDDATAPPKGDRWAIYYGYKAPASDFQNYNLVIFDYIYYPDFRGLHNKTTVLAYIRTGSGNNVLEGAHKQVAGAMYAPGYDTAANADLTCDKWKMLVENRVDDALKKGFDGVLLDALDSPLHTGRSTADNCREEAIALVDDVRNHHPRIKLMVNRAFSILPEIADKIDFVLADSIATERIGNTDQYRSVAPETYQQIAGSFSWAREHSPDLKIYTLDYWNMSDNEGVKKIYRLQRAQGFSPYVTSPDLQHFTSEPE